MPHKRRTHTCHQKELHAKLKFKEQRTHKKGPGLTDLMLPETGAIDTLHKLIQQGQSASDALSAAMEASYYAAKRSSRKKAKKGPKRRTRKGPYQKDPNKCKHTRRTINGGCPTCGDPCY